MPGLSNTERNGCKMMLSVMQDGALLSLCDTVTNKLIVVENIAEAMEAILSYSKDAEELLKRKKVHREIIFRYLAKEGVVMPPNSDKHQLVKRTLEFWSSGRVKQSPVSETKIEPEEVLTSSDANLEPDFDPFVFAKQFFQWFFQLLNSQNPSLGQQPQDWGPQHFWPDAQLRVHSSTDSQQTEKFQGAELVSLRLLAMTKDERLLFSPNLEPHGLRALCSPHGLVLVAVAGTIHRDTACLGVYEQRLGLIRSPLDNNSWKIKTVDLKIRAQSALDGTENIAPPALTCDSNELRALCGT